MKENEVVGWHYRLNGHEFAQTPGDGKGRRPGILQFMGSQRVRDDGETEQQKPTKSVCSVLCYS